MRKPWMVPAAWIAAPVLYVVLVGWLMLHGYLDVAVVLVVLAVLGLLGLAVWRWRAGHRRWAAALAVGALGDRGRHRVVRLQPQREDRPDPPRRRRHPRHQRGPTPEAKPTKAVNILLMGADNPQRLVKKPTIPELLEDGEWDRAPTAATP